MDRLLDDVVAREPDEGYERDCCRKRQKVMTRLSVMRFLPEPATLPRGMMREFS